MTATAYGSVHVDDVDFLTPRQVAERCQISYKSVLRAISSGDLEAYEIAGRKRIPTTAYKTWTRATPAGPATARPRAATDGRPGSNARLLDIEREHRQ